MLRIRTTVLLCGIIAFASGLKANVSSAANPNIGNSSTTNSSTTNGKHLIELGWDSPTPNIVKANLKAMEQQPFDGLVISLNAGKTIFNKVAYPESAYLQDRNDLAAISPPEPKPRLGHNFISIWSARETAWDWFDDSDWNAAETNARNFAKTAKAGRLKGFFFDPEPYGTSPWAYNAQLYPKQDFVSVQTKVRARGAAFLNAIQNEMPEVKILMLFGVTIVKAQAEEAGNLEKADWVLLASFIDGMLDVIKPQTELIDGHEGSYYLTNAQGFDDFRTYKQAARSYVSPENRAKYDQQFKIAHAVYVDGLLNLWNSPRFFGFYLRNETERQRMLEHNTFHALRSSDEYVWVYNENMDWWNSQGKGVRFPKRLDALLKRVQQKNRNGQALGFSLDSFLPQAIARFEAKVQIAGRITQKNQGVGEVYLDSGFTINGTDSACGYSNPDGYFACIVPANWTGKIVPMKKGLRFDPPVLNLKKISKNIDNQNFSATDK
jgi:hypothetical protein